jgi:hypothetical protein
MSRNHKSNTKLDRYIRSRGAYLPVGFEKYRAPYGDNHALCVLCDSLHDNEEFTIISEVEKREFIDVLEGVHTCSNCSSAITAMKNLNSRHSEDIFYKALSNKDVAKNSKIDSLLFDGRFAADCYYSLTHLESKYEYELDISLYTVKHCYFCQGVVEETTSNFMWVPCGNDPYTVDGGTILTCASCIKEISGRLPEKSISNFYTNTFQTAVCPTCGEPYYMINDEFKMRTDFHGKQNIEYQCGPCAYKFLHTTEHNRLFTADKTMQGKVSRYRDDVCDLCLEEFAVDLMILPSSTISRHINKEGQIVCAYCECANIPAFAAIVVGDIIYNFTQGVRDPNLFHIKKRKKSGRVLAVWGPLNYEKFETIVEELMDADAEQLTMKM